MDFFTAEDVEILTRVGHKPYRKGPAQCVRDAELVKSGPLAKTAYWAGELKKRLPDFEFSMNRHWQRRGYFSSYTWVKIFRPRDSGKDIYFTIGVDGEENSLVYKLDYQFDSTSRLSDAQKNICRRLKKTSKTGWRTIEVADFASYTWDRLVDEVADFIRTNEPVYEAMIRKACFRTARICWNGNSWLYPSGREGKSSGKETFEWKHGYGYEEWLFDLDKRIDGYHYGFLEPVLKAAADCAGGCYDLLLWTLDGKEHRRYAVANLRNVEILKASDSQAAYNIYRQNGWLSEMLQQVRAVEGDVACFRQSSVLFNIRFKPEDVEFLDYADITGCDSLARQNRYVLVEQSESLRSLFAADRDNAFVFQPNRRSAPSAAVGATGFSRPARFVELRHRHAELSNRLVASLEARYGASHVAQENTVGVRRIDAVVRTSAGDVFYEIKTNPSLRASVREALGQLLEYAFYPDRRNAVELVVVAMGDERSDEYRAIAQYMEQLRAVLNYPIYFMLCNRDYVFLEKV